MFTQDGQITTQWFRWLNNVYTITGSGLGITPVINGGTGLGTIPTNGKLLIGNGTGYTLNTLTAGTGITVTNGAGTITVTNSLPDLTVVLTGAGTTVVTGTYPSFTITSNDAFVGTVTSVGGTGTVNGITLTGTVTTAGSLTLGGTLSGVGRLPTQRERTHRKQGEHEDRKLSRHVAGTASSAPNDSSQVDIVFFPFRDGVSHPLLRVL